MPAGTEAAYAPEPSIDALFQMPVRGLPADEMSTVASGGAGEPSARRTDPAITPSSATSKSRCAVPPSGTSARPCAPKVEPSRRAVKRPGPASSPPRR